MMLEPSTGFTSFLLADDPSAADGPGRAAIRRVMSRLVEREQNEFKASQIREQPDLDKQAPERSMTNVLGGSLAQCGGKNTGWLEDGFCKPVDEDDCRHVVCAKPEMSFLQIQRAIWGIRGTTDGKDLRTGWQCICKTTLEETVKLGGQVAVDAEATHWSAFHYVYPLQKKFGNRLGFGTSNGQCNTKIGPGLARWYRPWTWTTPWTRLTDFLNGE